MPFHSQLNQGNDLLRQFFTTLVPGFGPAKEQEFQNKIGKVKRIPGMSIQEGLSFQTNKASIFTPEFNGTGPFPFFFGNGYMPPPAVPGNPGGESGDAGSGDDGSNGPWYPPPGGDQDPDGPPVPEPETSNSGSGSGSESSGSGSEEVSASTSGGSGSGSVELVAEVDGGDVDTGEPTLVVVDALTAPDTEIIDGNT